MIVQFIQYIGCILTAAVGALSLFAPNKIVGFTGLAAQGPRGITEIRALLGGLFIALGVGPFFLGNVAYTFLGVCYLVIGIVRLPSIFFDRSGSGSNWTSLVFELFFGVIFIL